MGVVESIKVPLLQANWGFLAGNPEHTSCKGFQTAKKLATSYLDLCSISRFLKLIFPQEAEIQAKIKKNKEKKKKIKEMKETHF